MGDVRILFEHGVKVATAEQDNSVRMFFPYALDVFCHISFHNLKNLL